jgi:sulfur-oxidizing protein SoxY
MKRRVFLKLGLTAGEIALAVKAGCLWPVAVLASDWPADGFFASEFDAALELMLGGEPVEESGHVRLEAFDLAEDGAMVPIGVDTDLTGVRVVSLFSVNNPTPAVGRFELSPRLTGRLDTRIKMAKSGEVVAVVSSGGRHYGARRQIKVTAGGCA